MTEYGKTFPKNTGGRDFVVGDIHGRFDLMAGLVRAAKFDETKDRMFSFGDLVDRGAYSNEVLEWLGKPWFHAIRGNHEQMAIDYAVTQFNPSMYIQNGGHWFVMLPHDRQLQIAHEFEQLPFYVEFEHDDVGSVALVHASCHTDNWKKFVLGMKYEAKRQAAIWARSPHDEVDGKDLVVVGHTPVAKPTKYHNVLNIDTGAYKTGILTMVELGDPLVFWDSRDV